MYVNSKTHRFKEHRFIDALKGCLQFIIIRIQTPFYNCCSENNDINFIYPSPKKCVEIIIIKASLRYNLELDKVLNSHSY